MWGVAGGLLLLAVGAVLVFVGSRSLGAADTRRTALVQSTFVTSAASEQFAAFQATDTFGFAMDEPAFVSFYLWNLTNAAAVLRGAEAPKVAQIGPYVYEKKSRKVNVTFHTRLPLTSQNTQATPPSSDYGYVSYGVQSSYTFVPQRSNGSEVDIVATLNASYARTLTKYRHLGYSERLLVAEYAQQHMQEYHRHLQQEFIAETKQRGLQFFLPDAIDKVTQESIGPAIQRQRERIDSASIPANLVRMYAVARAEAIPQVLGDVRKDISDRFLPGILQQQFEAAKDHALPRVLSNLLNRLKVEAVPVMLQKQIETQFMRQVPFTLNSLASKLPQLAFPYVLQETYDRACLEVVPFILRTIKLEIIGRDIATNVVQADVAQYNVIETWRKYSTAAQVDFDSWIDDNPTGKSRTGFELRPTTASLELSNEVATMLLGSKASNKRFSIVDYDVLTTASYPLDTPTNTPVGFAIWKQVIAMNETSISYLIDGVNNDVARQTDYLTRAQVMFVRDYLIQWAQRDVTKRDRERFWRQNYVKRTSRADFNEPAVDLDIEKAGLQIGFNVQFSGASTSGITPDIARQLWDSSNSFSFTSLQGFTLWFDAGVVGKASAVQQLTAGVTGITSAQLSEIATWVKVLLNDGFITRRALRHWSDGTCLNVLKLSRPSCLIYDLEPHISGTQSGFEMNPLADKTIVVSQSVREVMWNSTTDASFLNSVYAADTSKGYGRWMQALRTGDTTDVVAALSSTYPSFTKAVATGITRWLSQWIQNDLHRLNVQNWWRTATCWPRVELSKSSITSVVTPGIPSCTQAIQETEQASPPAVVTVANQSPFFTTERTLSVEKIECAWDASSSTFTKTVSSYQTSVREYSCDAFSTELSDDHAGSDFKTGFEVAPTLASAPVALRPSLAAAVALWNPANKFSFLHGDGYKQWVFDFPQDSSSVRQVLVSSINDRITSACAQISGGGIRSAIFNVTLIGSDSGCGPITSDQVDMIQKWVASLSTSPWVENALLDVWRRGDPASALDIEPYRSKKQTGWELSIGCACSLTSLNSTSYAVPRAALSLWKSDSNAASFLSQNGYAMWTALANATASGDTVSATAKKKNIAVACGQAKWEPWFDYVVSWLEAWRTNDHLFRDVIGHWLHGTCPTPSSLPVVGIVSNSQLASSTAASCPPANARYKIALNDTLDDILKLASRPTFEQFFDSNVVEKTALIQPSKVVELTEELTTCDFVSTNQYKLASQTRVTVREYPTCNFLVILSTGATSSMPIVEEETHFELNRTVEKSRVSMEVALTMWLDGTSEWAFTNVTNFLEKWQPAIHRNEALVALENDLNAAVASALPSALQDVTDYLEMWETSSVAARVLGRAWLVNTSPFYDLDPLTEGNQGGFELVTAPGWRKIFGVAASALPTLGQAQYLWDATKEYSFLNRDVSTLSGGLPIGFSAWREVYDGVDYSSERLVSKFPPVPSVETDDTVIHRLSESDRKSLVALMAGAIGLTADQVKAIASWLMPWSENIVLRDYVLETWATGLTPRGEQNATVDLSKSLPIRFALKPPVATTDHFTCNAQQILAKVPKVARRKIWTVATPGSLINPQSRNVWCLIDLPTLGPCPDTQNDLGFVNETSFETFADIVQSAVQDRGKISRISNFTMLALLYFERQFDLTEEQTIGIAVWWRSLPHNSAFFEALQVQRWQSTTDPFALVDPLWIGFGVARVFSTSNGPVKRRATADDLVVNPINSAPSSCELSLDLGIALWKRLSPSSFLHPDGQKKWVEYAHSKPRTSGPLVKYLSDSDGDIKTVIAALPSASTMCNIDAVANWILSWENHPVTRQFVESLWYQSANSTASPLKYFKNPSTLVVNFPIDSGVPLTSRSESTLRFHARVAEITLDFNESTGFRNLTNGFPKWKAVLSNCTSSSVSTFKCIAASQSEVQRDFVSAVIHQLGSEILDRALDLDPELDQDDSSASQAVLTIFTPWLLYWLDHKLLLDFILQRAADADHKLQAKISSLNYGDFAAAQFIGASFSRMSFSLPSYGPDPNDYREHDGAVSERLTRSRLVFEVRRRAVELQQAEGVAGFAEFGAFCSWNQYDRVYAYDAVTKCSVGGTYNVSFAAARAILTTLSDPDEWGFPNSSVSIKRAALLIDVLLAQPITKKEDCIAALGNLAIAYSLPAATTKDACKLTADGFLLDLPVFSSMGFDTSSPERVKDFQAYLRYVATKFVYEGAILQLSPRSLNASELTQPPPTLGSWGEYPLGGYIAIQQVSYPLTARDLRLSLWQTDVLDTQNPITTTYLVPTRNEQTLVSQNRERVLGEITLLNGSSTMIVQGVSTPLSVGHFTDGSQFVTAILAGRNIGKFPPTKLRFYWAYFRRIVQLTFSKNVTRFGVPLMRYTVENWQEPTGLPSGLDTTAVNDPNAPTVSINMSSLFQDLPMVLLSAPATPPDDKFEPSRETAVDIDPVTGVVYHRRMSWQLTSRISPPDTKNDLWHREISATWLPVLWAREQYSVSSSSALQFLSKTANSGPFAAEKLAWWGIIGGTVYIVVGMVVGVVYIKRARMMRLRKMQSVMPSRLAETSPSKIEPRAPSIVTELTSTSDSQLLARQVDETSGVSFEESSLISVHTSPRARKRTASRIPTITEDREDTPDIQQV